jgi:hypothetical protein
VYKLNIIYPTSALVEGFLTKGIKDYKMAAEIFILELN